jgi:phage terminase large subunit-like protein
VGAGKDYIAIAAQYQADVLSGVIPACKWVRLACQRNRRDLDRQETDAFHYRFDPVAGVKICQFAELLPHIKGDGYAYIVGEDEDGRPIWNTIVLEPWQCWLLTVLFGWKRVKNGRRRFRVALVLVPRKNAKSTIGAVIALYMFAVEGGSGAECYSAATTRDQAKIVAEIAWEMAARSPQFREQFGIRLGSRTTRSLTIPTTAAKFGPLSADAQSLDGLNILLAIIDELHAHKTRAVWDVLDTATGAQLEPLLVALTTAGVEIGGICYEKMAYLEKILDGVATDDAFFGLNYTIDHGDENHLDSEIVQRKANPNYGVSVQPDDLERKVGESKLLQSAKNNVLTKHFNVWIRTESSWIGNDLWQGGHVRGLTLEALKGYPCWIGVDLAEVRDFAAVVPVFRIADDTFAAIPRLYLPKATVERSPIAQLSGWARAGFIVQTDGDQADFLRIEDDIVALFEQLKVQEIDFDRALASQMQQSLKRRLEPKVGRDGVDRLIITVPQDTPTMDAAMKMTERLVLSKKLQHDGNPAMAWMVSNVVVQRTQTTDEIRPNKAGGKDSPNKIDGLVAMLTALSQAMRGATKPPAYQMLFIGGRR